jgi:hypothetical protein
MYVWRRVYGDVSQSAQHRRSDQVPVRATQALPAPSLWRRAHPLFPRMLDACCLRAASCLLLHASCFMRAAYACVQCVSKNIVFPRKRIQGSTKLSPMDHMMHWIFVLVQKDSNAKKESY